MIRKVSDIMLKNFKSIDLLEGVKVAQHLVVNKGIDFFPVFEEDSLIGILTYKHLIGVHSNRIVADAMSSKIISVSSSTPLWQAKEMFEKNDIDVLLVIDNEELIGIISKTMLYTELGKHVDLLTGLYKSDYIYYYAKKLIKNKQSATIIFIDINNFGYIDKKYGHIQGDLILKELAILLKNSIPLETFLCRFGGDEFIVLTPYALDQCINLTEYLIKEISGFHFSNEIKINVSAGIAISSSQQDYENFDSIVYELINEASLASTTAKKEKNLFHVAESIVQDSVSKIKYEIIT